MTEPELKMSWARSWALMPGEGLEPVEHVGILGGRGGALEQEGVGDQAGHHDAREVRRSG